MILASRRTGGRPDICRNASGGFRWHGQPPVHSRLAAPNADRRERERQPHRLRFGKRRRPVRRVRMDAARQAGRKIIS